MSFSAFVNQVIPVSPKLCHICEEKATGRHYGAVSCDGCKGFFRRSIKRPGSYVCRCNQNCQIKKDMRNICRYCRYKKCLEAGMKVEAVQKDRDAWKIRPTDVENDLSSKHIKSLLQAEHLYKEMRKSVHGPTGLNTNEKEEKLASKLDLADAIKNELLLLVEWVKMMPLFTELEMPDQVALLRAYASKFMMISLATESLNLSDALALPSGPMILREHLVSPGFKVVSPTGTNAVNLNIFERVMDEIVEPMKALRMDEMEMVWFKAIVLFNPYTSGITQKEHIKEVRNELISGFERYIGNKCLEANGRLAHIMLLTSAVEVVAQMAHESLRVCSFCGLILEDQLMHELLFANPNNSEVISQYAIPLQSLQNPIIQKLEYTVKRFHSFHINEGDGSQEPSSTGGQTEIIRDLAHAVPTDPWQRQYHQSPASTPSYETDCSSNNQSPSPDQMRTYQRSAFSIPNIINMTDL